MRCCTKIKISQKAQTFFSYRKQPVVNSYVDVLRTPPAGEKNPPKNHQNQTKHKVCSQEIHLSGFQTYFVSEVFGRTLHASIQVRDMNEFFHTSFLTYLCDTLRNIYKFVFKSEVSKARQDLNITLRAINNSCHSAKKQLLHIT